MTVAAAAAYLNAQVPEYNAGGAPGQWNGGWTADRVRGVLATPRLGWVGVTHGRIDRASGEPATNALVQNVTDGSVTYYKQVLRAPFDGVTNV